MSILTWLRQALVAIAVLSGVALATDPAPVEAPPPRVQIQDVSPVAPSLLTTTPAPIDLATALRLAGVQNPEIQLASERVTEAVALRQLAAAQILPNLNAGTSVNLHNGPLQQANGNILKVDRGSLYVGLGAQAVGAGTVTVPGVFWSGNVAEVAFRHLVSRQVVRGREFTAEAVRNDVLLRVAVAYVELLRAEGRRAIAGQNRVEAAEVARVTASYARAGQGRKADADRAAAELGQRDTELAQSEGDVLAASARLCQLLDLDPATQLHVADTCAAPAPLVPDLVPLPELLAIALTRRPELKERQAAIRAALLELHGARALPFSPNLLVGYSAGAFGGGSNLIADGIRQPDGSVLRQSRFGNYGDRQDFDAVLFWTLRNLGVGNVALVRLAQSNVRDNQLRETVVLDRVRSEVAAAHARTQARAAQIDISEQAVRAGAKAFQEDLIRTRNREGLPIEVLDSLRLLARGRYAYLDAILDYNRAQFELYVALGQPPADCLARPVPASAVPAVNPAPTGRAP